MSDFQARMEADRVRESNEIEARMVTVRAVAQALVARSLREWVMINNPFPNRGDILPAHMQRPCSSAYLEHTDSGAWIELHAGNTRLQACGVWHRPGNNGAQPSPYQIGVECGSISIAMERAGENPTRAAKDIERRLLPHVLTAWEAIKKHVAERDDFEAGKQRLRDELAALTGDTRKRSGDSHDPYPFRLWCESVLIDVNAADRVTFERVYVTPMQARAIIAVLKGADLLGDREAIERIHERIHALADGRDAADFFDTCVDIVEDTGRKCRDCNDPITVHYHHTECSIAWVTENTLDEGECDDECPRCGTVVTALSSHPADEPCELCDECPECARSHGPNYTGKCEHDGGGL